LQARMIKAKYLAYKSVTSFRKHRVFRTRWDSTT